MKREIIILFYFLLFSDSNSDNEMSQDSFILPWNLEPWKFPDLTGSRTKIKFLIEFIILF